MDTARGQKILDLLDIQGIDTLREAVGEDNPGYQSLATLMEYAQASGIASAISIDLSVVRGLSYYTGTVWELFDTAGNVPRAIAGGGRYDRLMETLGGEPTPMVGFGFGDVVISLLLEERGLLPKESARVDDVVYPMDASGFAAANQIAASLGRMAERSGSTSRSAALSTLSNARNLSERRQFTCSEIPKSPRGLSKYARWVRSAPR